MLGFFFTERTTTVWLFIFRITEQYAKRNKHKLQNSTGENTYTGEEMQPGREQWGAM